MFIRDAAVSVVRTLLMSLGLAMLASSALADVIALQTAVESKVDRGQLHFSIELKNVGNEEAVEIALEFPTLTRKFPIASALVAGETKSAVVDLPLSKPGPTDKGSFTIPYRITYKDTNAYGLSSAQLLMITQPPAPSRQLAIRFEDADPSPQLVVAENGSLEAKGEVKNLGNQPVLIDSIYAISSLELRHDVSAGGMPRELKPKESLTFTLNINNEGALRGSECAGFFVVEGQVEGLRLSEQIGYKVQVVPPRSTSRLFLIGAAVLAFVAILLLKRSKKH